MCGIAGLFDLSGAPVAEDLLLRMRDSLAHRGPDDVGAWVDGAIGLAHRRLSIIDLDDGQQPMCGAGGRVVLTYNGEIYNYRELRRELESRGHTFRTQSDTEVVLESYLQWGEEACSHFNGMFSFAIWDSRHGKLILARDRLGIKPLYWTRIGDQFAFASEIKAFLQHPSFRVEASLDAISSYMTFRQAVWDNCFFKNVNKVLPGTILTISNGDINSRTYWELPQGVPGPDLGEEEYLGQAGQLLEDAVKKRMVADVPVGAYLSGGLDSSLLAATMASGHSGKVQTFSIGYDKPKYDEGQYARLVSSHVGSEHDHLTITEDDYVDNWRSLIRHNDIPLSIPHEVPLHQLSKHMKTKVSVALSGEGADELFGGYGRVQRSPMDWKKISAVRAFLGESLAGKIGNLGALDGSPLSSIKHSTHLQHFFDVYNWIPFEEKWDLLSVDALKSIDKDAYTVSLFEKAFNQSSRVDPYDRVLHIFQKFHLGALLDRLDMMSMASGLEARVPFVDHELVEYVVNIPHHYKMRWNSPLSKMRALFHSSSQASEWLDTSKYLLRQIGAQKLPPEISNRKKLGFPTPLDSWFQGGMMDFARDMLLDPNARTRGMFDTGTLKKLLASPQNLPYDFYGIKIWMLTNIELWFREVIDEQSSAIR